MSKQPATAAYETWLGKRIPLLPADLKLKHQRMTEGVFPFLRATFYRWAQLWPDNCPELVNAPVTLAVGDLHIENFGTWRDSEGRLVWGVNDFDEACELPYAVDLVRLAVSALLATSEGTTSCTPADACAAILNGYTEGIHGGGKPFVLEELHHGLRTLALSDLRDPVRFWDKMNRWPRADKVPPQIKNILVRALPEPVSPYQILHRQAGLGSLGRRRFTLVAQWCGGYIAREAKELVPSAWHWMEKKQSTKISYATIVSRAVRVADPTVSILCQQWFIRRLALGLQLDRVEPTARQTERIKIIARHGARNSEYPFGHIRRCQKNCGGFAQAPFAMALQRRPGDGMGHDQRLETVAHVSYFGKCSASVSPAFFTPWTMPSVNSDLRK